jgi:hypothetical protein
MSRTRKDSRKKGYRGDRRVRVRGVRRAQIDYDKLSRALIELELARAKAEQEAQCQTKDTPEVGGSQ